MKHTPMISLYDRGVNTGKRPLLVVEQDCLIVTERIIREVEKAGFQSLRSFDLDLARSSRQECLCPDHGPDRCTCHLVILLILMQGHGLLTIILEGQDQRTTINLDAGQNGAEEQVNPLLTGALLKAIRL